MITLRITRGWHPWGLVCGLWINAMDIHRRFYPPIRAPVTNNAGAHLLTGSTEPDLQGISGILPSNFLDSVGPVTPGFFVAVRGLVCG